MIITPMEPMIPIKAGKATKDLADSTIGGGFKQIFTDMYDQYKTEESKFAEDSYALSVGGTDDLHNLEINMKKVELSLSLFLQVRTKALDAYNELIRMNV